MAGWKMPDAQLAPHRAEMAKLQAETQAFEVHRDNWASVQLFRRLETQWHGVLGMTGFVYLGLNYAAIAPAMQMCGIPARRRAAVFTDLQIMERAALPELNRAALPQQGQPAQEARRGA